MNLLDKVKNKLGLNKDKKAGHVLGGGEAKANEDIFFDVTFTEESLGLTVHAAPPDHIMSGSPIVVDVVDGSPAFSGGVRTGDIIVSVESNSGHISYGDFVDVVQALGRPVILRFQRLSRSSIVAKRQQQQQTKKSAPALSSAERDAQREAMREAALTREKQWDKRVSSAASHRRRKAPESPHALSSAGEGVIDPPLLGRQLSEEEKSAARERAKAAEQKTIDELGYNPFQPHFSSNSSEVRSQVSAATSGSHITASAAAAPKLLPTPPSPGAAGAGDTREADLLMVESQLREDEVAAVDGALYELAHGDQERAIRKMCVDTAVKMLTNIQSNPQEAKFKSIRLSNANFRAKVAEVEGGLELMLGAGFELSEGAGEQEGETFLRHAEAAVSAGGGQGEGDEAQFLNRCQLKLTYTLHRRE